MSRNDGGRAFPSIIEAIRPDNETAYVFSKGMTLRQYYAAHALQGILANKKTHGPAREIAQELAASCFALADALIEAEEQE